MLVRRKARHGFSLTEILVALAIIAILSAVLMPAVNSQLGKSDAARAASDLVAVQTAVQSFMGDVHRAPQTVAQLTTKIKTSDNDLGNANSVPPSSAAPFADYLVANWRGPYLSRDVVGQTRLGNIQDAFSVTTVGTSFYLTVTMTSVASQDWTQIEAILDEGTSSSTAAVSGTVRYTGTTLTFLAVPLY